MKRYLLLAQVLLLSVFVYAQNGRTQLQLHSFTESKSDGGMENLGSLFQKGWPKDINGERDCAWIRVTFENMTDDDARNVEFSFGNASPLVDKRDRMREREKEIWLFVTPSDNAIMEASLTKYGKSNRLPDIILVPHHVYDVVLRNEKTLSINITTKPENILATLETKQRAQTPATITDVAMGAHVLTLSKDGITLKQDTIMVTEQNVRFEYDLRKKKMIRFVSDPQGAVLYINDKEIGKTPVNIELPYDSYNVEAILSPTETDSRAVSINDNTPYQISLEPVKKRTFDVIAVYGGTKVNADLYVNGRRVGKQQPSYTLTKPIGNTYDMTMTYLGYSKERKIKVRQNMDDVQTFKISAHNYIVWPWQREYDVAPMGITVGYVTKQLVTRGNGRKYKHEGAWGKEGKFLHGFQLGLHFQPCFSFGLGIYTGLFYEFYYSKNGRYESELYEPNEDGSPYHGYKEYMEHCLYVPVHAYYRIPFARRVALSIHGGLGFSYSVKGEYKNSDNGFDDLTDFYGDDGFPKAFNVSADIAFGLRIGSVQLNAQYSKGISNHKSYMKDYETKQNKLNVGVSYLFSAE